MTHSLAAPTVAPDGTAGPRHRRGRIGAVAGGVALLIVAGGYEAARTASPDVHPPALRSATGDSVQPSAAVMRDMQEAVIGQYGVHASAPARAGGAHAQATGTEVRPGPAVMHDLHISIARQYGRRH